MPVPSVNQWNMRNRPITPYGSGNADSRASRGVSMAFIAITTRSARSVRV